MKRLIAAAALFALAVPAFAMNDGYDSNPLRQQNDWPALSTAFEGAARTTPPQAGSSVPREQAATEVEERHTALASSGETRRDRDKAIEDSFKSIWATGPWANDYHFIAPR